MISRLTQKTNSPRLANIDIDVSPASNSVSSTQHPPFFRPIPSFPNPAILKSSTGKPHKTRVTRKFYIDTIKKFLNINAIVWIILIRTVLYISFLSSFHKIYNLHAWGFTLEFQERAALEQNHMDMIRPFEFQTSLTYK